MTDTLPSPEIKPAKRCCWKRKLLCLLLLPVIVLALAFGLGYCPWFIRMHGGSATGDLTQMQQRLTTLETQVRDLQQQTAAIPAAAPPATLDAAQPAASAAPVADTAHMQSDIAAMSATIATLQNEIKQNGSQAAESQQATQATLASAIAFIQLRETASAGQSFTNELAAMHDAAKNDAAFQEQLGKLEAIAPKGAPTAAILREDLIAAEPEASLAVERTTADTWWQRLLTEFKTLVSVRKQHGGETDALTEMENNLGKGDVSAALSDMQNLPPEAQQALTDWRTKAEARQTVDNVLRAMAAHFTALANPVTPAPAQAAP